MNKISGNISANTTWKKDDQNILVGQTFVQSGVTLTIEAGTTIYSESIGQEDPPEIVIDEWVGQWIALWLIPHSFIWGFVSFLFFRVFDILKPGPVQLMDDIKSGTGIMMDDVIAGILALLVTQSLVYFIG